MAQWIGYMVSIKCANMGTYQGEIQSATNQFITLTKAFRNGFPCDDTEVKIRAVDIQDLKLIEKLTSSPPERSTVSIAKPVAKRAGRTQSTSESIVLNKTKEPVAQKSMSNNKSKPIDIIEPRPSTNGLSSGGSSNNCIVGSGGYLKNLTPNKRDTKTRGKGRSWKDEECFGSPLNQKINKDFDFEKNLALFDKQAIWHELNAQKPDVIKHAETKKPTKYRHDENVIATLPAIYRQISVPKQDVCEYATDDGLIIPSVSRALRKKLFEAADRVGLTWDRRVELMGRAASEMSIQLLGGGHRLNPRNMHQWPMVIVLCGPHKQGAVGINAARQLASHGVKTIVYAVSPEAPVLGSELALYRLTKNRLVGSVQELPHTSDLIVLALCEDSDSPKHYPCVSDWMKKNKAPVLAIDPPSTGTPGITPKLSLLPVLPLPHGMSNGKLYLCNLGFPLDVFNEVGIKYKSPFGPKFVIPLHPREDAD